MKKQLFLSPFLLISTAALVFAEANPAAFLDIGVGGRAMGLGGAYVSLSDDPTAMYWNPAGLARVERMGMTAMGQSPGASKWNTQSAITPAYQFVGLTFPLRQFDISDLVGMNNTFGVGYLSNSLSGVQYTTLGSDGNIVRDTFDDYEKAYFLSYGFALAAEERISVGTTFKYITQEFTKIDGAKATGYDMSLGMMYGWDENMNIGLLLERGVEMKWANGHADSGALSTRLGASKKFPLSTFFSLLGSMDLVQKQNQPVFGHLGTELGFKPFVSAGVLDIKGAYLRMGLDGVALENRYDYRDKINNNLNYTMGLGLNLSYFGYAMQLDYVMGSYRLGDKNKFSINLYF